jgi:hypothetical protein
MSESILEMVIIFMANNPHLAVLITIMAVARSIFKPACSLVQAYVDSTPSQSDNKKWKEIQEHKAFKAVAYLLDLFLSIKLPVKK